MTTALALAARSGSIHFTPGLTSFVVVAVVLGLTFALVKWAGVPWWAILLGIVFGILLIATHLLGPSILTFLKSHTHGNFL